MDELDGRPAYARGDGPLRIWTAKEAVAKATGLGFRLRLALIAVHGESNGPPAEFGTGAAEETTPWRLASLRLTPYHDSGGRRAPPPPRPPFAPPPRPGGLPSRDRPPRPPGPTRAPPPPRPREGGPPAGGA